MILPPDTVLNNRYRIVRLVGQGGMGAVYEAIDERLLNRVAIKQLTVQGEMLSRAFKREARLLANIDHPVLPDVTDHFGEGDGEYLVMEYIPGQDLAGIQQQNSQPFPVDLVLKWGDQILSALEYLHAQNPPIIHRDIKPQNLKLKPSGDIMLLDFGLAKGANFDVTRISKLSGYTPGFSAPEQVEDAATDERSELYSLAATLHQLLTNGVPIDATTRLRAAAGKRPDPLRPAHEINPSVPVAVSKVLEQALALEPDDRPQSASAMRAALQQARHPAHTEVDRGAAVYPVGQHTEIDHPSVPVPVQRPTSQPTEVEQNTTQQPNATSHPVSAQPVTSRTPWGCLAIVGGTVLVLVVVFAVLVFGFINRINSVIALVPTVTAIAGGVDPDTLAVDPTATTEVAPPTATAVLPAVVGGTSTALVDAGEPTEEATPAEEVPTEEALEPTEEAPAEEATPTTQPASQPTRTPVLFPTFTPQQQLVPDEQTGSGNGNADNVSVPGVLAANFGNVVVGSSFDAAANIWPIADETDYVVGAADGTYAMQLLSPQQYLTSRPDQPGDLTDSGISAEVSIEDTDGFGGVLMRYSESGGKSNLYTCWISLAQEYGCAKLINDEWDIIVDMTTESSIRTSGVNRVVMIARGDQFTFIINGKQAARFRDNALAQGTSGLYIENFDTPVTVRFDDVVIVQP